MKSKKQTGIPMIFLILIMLFLLLLSFSIALSYVGYNQFTKIITKQYSENAISIAKSATNLVNPDRIHAYLKENGQSEDYAELKSIYTQICNDFDASYVYIIEPNIEKNYEEITFVISSANDNSLSEAYETGYTTNTTNEEYRAYYQDIYENSLESAVVVRDKGLKVNSKPHITALVPIKNASGEIVAIMAAECPMSYLNQARAEFINGIILVVIAILLITFILVSSITILFIIKPIKTISKETERFAKENTKSAEFLSDKVSIIKEIKVLASTINDMEERTLNYFTNLNSITAEKERISTELNVATHIQASSLPSIFPAFPHREEFDIFATMNPAKEVGGDFYDFYLIDNDHLALTIADVSGKGVPAALFMMISKTMLKDQTHYNKSPKLILETVNNKLCENNEAEMFVTAWIGILEISTGKMIASNAGHEFPAIKRKDGSFELIQDKHGLVLAGLEGMKYSEYEIQLNPGDVLYVYTDGVAEATNTRNELFGTNRMLTALNEADSSDIKELLSHVREEIDKFVGEAPQFDDITMLALKYIG